jgi:ribosomal protein S18 acetylase RimI-like enzyme
MSTLEIARPEDGEQIINLIAHTENFNSADVECVKGLWKISQTLGAETAGFQFVVCREEEHILGMICYGPHVGTVGPYDVYWLAVDREARHHHIGKRLLEYVEQDVLQRGGNLISIETSFQEMYEPTRKFYAACGYVEEACIRDFYSQGDGLVIFVKRLGYPVSAAALSVISNNREVSIA